MRKVRSAEAPQPSRPSHGHAEGGWATTGPIGYETTDGVVHGGSAAYLVIAPSSEDAITPTQHQPPDKSPATPLRRILVCRKVPAVGRTLHDYAEQSQPLPSGDPQCAMWVLRGHLRGPEDTRGAQNHG